MKIKYVKHPVSKELKAELRAQGYTIIDIRFAPPEVREAMCDSENQKADDDVATADNDVTVDTDAASSGDDQSDTSTGDGVTVDGYESLTEESLTDLSKEELSDIARNLGVQFHGSSGAEKIMRAIIESGLL